MKSFFNIFTVTISKDTKSIHNVYLNLRNWLRWANVFTYKKWFKVKLVQSSKRIIVT